ncbi:MAG: endonuclease MutS2 [Oscillospiraceae bacterium]|nr:endonuclease MutS2 [Oscillospiraceae bacterium]
MQKHYRTLELDKILALLAERCACPDARELALALEPEPNLDLARAALRQTHDAHMLLARFGGPSFGGLKNLANTLRRAQAGGMLSLRELLDVAQVLRVMRGIAAWRESNSGVETALDSLFGGIAVNKYLEDAIGNAVLSEDRVADHASPALADIRRKIRQQESSVRGKLEQLTRSPRYAKVLQESIVTMRGGRFVVPVKAEYRAEIPGLVHDSSASGATVFVEPMAVVEANNEIKVLEGKEREEIDRIVLELSALAGSFYESIQAGYECAAELNLIFAKAHLAYDMKASLPELGDGGEINLLRARHPLIAKSKAVPIDVSLGEGFDTLVITGPNTGGKTVTLKTIGLLTLMAMCGLMLPVSEPSRVSVFRQVLADIGDEQSIEQSLSTFSSHMTNIIDILQSADDRSLVLIDELGAGTDPVEGAALAASIIEALRAKNAKLAATTHYAELKAYALKTERVENACCEFDVETLRPTYRLLTGVPGRSNAFAISERLGMPAAVVDRAQRLVSGEDWRFEDVIRQLEERQNLADRAREEAEALRLEAREALAQAARVKEEALTQQEKAIEEARRQAKQIIEQTRREAYALLAELEKLKKEKDSENDIAALARRARAAVKKGMDSVNEAANPAPEEAPEPEEDYVLPRPLELGDTVRVAGLGVEATVLALPDAKGIVALQAGALKTRAALDKLRLVTKNNGENNIPHHLRPRKVKEEPASRMNMAADTRLDLRGLMVDECLLELDRFLDGALRTGLHEFTIVHGKGTGALRAAVQKHLKGCTFVKTFRLGVYGEGETGVTIVELK